MILVLSGLLTLVMGCVFPESERTPVQRAIDQGQESTMEFLLSEPDQDTLDSGLFISASIQDLEMVRLFVEAGADPAVELGGNYVFALLVLGLGDRVEVADYLREQGADPCAITGHTLDRWGPYVDTAKERGQVGLADWFLEATSSC